MSKSLPPTAKALWLSLLLAALTHGITVAQARSLEEIKASGEIRFCIWASDDPNSNSPHKAQPPGCRDDCTLSGTFYEWSVAFAEWLDPEIEPKFWRMVSWLEHFHNEQGEVVKGASDTPALLASGTCDLYSTYLARYPWRLNQIDIVPLLVDGWMVVVHTSNQDQFKTLTDLGGKVTEGAEGGGTTTTLQELNQTVLADNPVRFRYFGGDFSKVYDALEANAGEVDFLLLPAATALHRTRYVFKNLVGVFTVGQADPVGWDFRKQDKDLQAAAKAFFDEQRPDLDSPLNQAWKGYTGMTIPRFIELVTAIK